MKKLFLFSLDLNAVNGYKKLVGTHLYNKALCIQINMLNG